MAVAVRMLVMMIVVVEWCWEKGIIGRGGEVVDNMGRGQTVPGDVERRERTCGWEDRSNDPSSGSCW